MKTVYLMTLLVLSMVGSIAWSSTGNDIYGGIIRDQEDGDKIELRCLAYEYQEKFKQDLCVRFEMIKTYDQGKNTTTYQFNVNTLRHADRSKDIPARIEYDHDDGASELYFGAIRIVWLMKTYGNSNQQYDLLYDLAYIPAAALDVALLPVVLLIDGGMRLNNYFNDQVPLRNDLTHLFNTQEKGVIIEVSSDHFAGLSLFFLSLSAV